MSGPAKKGGWGSFLKQAVEGLESNLDTILSGDDVPQSKAAQSAATPKVAPKPASGSRSSSANPTTNDRLQERLARAVAAKKHAQANGGSTTPGSNTPSRVASPATVKESPRASLDAPAADADTATDEASVEVDKPDAATEVAAAVEDVSNGAIQSEGESSPMPRASTDTTTSKPKASTEAGGSQSLEVPDIASRSSDVSREQQILADADREEEIYGYIERIDALQAKLQYLAQESAEKARKAAAEAPAGTLEKKLAEKDEQIALLMEEGQKLSKTELKHMTAIKKLRAKSQESERATAEVAKKMEKLEKENSDLAERLKAAEAAQKQVGEKQRQVDQLRKENDKLRSERDSRDVFIASLKSQIAEAASEAKANESKKTQELLDTEKKKVANLEEEVSTVKIERELAEQKLRAQIEELRAKNERELERARATETELKGEIQMLEGRLEVMRARTEEVSSGAIGDSQAKLLRQIETLQTQYSVASDNWQGIESSLNSRIALLQKEKVEALKREADIKKKAREMTTKVKAHDDEMEILESKLSDLQKELTHNKAMIEKLQKRAEAAESALEGAKKSFETEKQNWDAELNRRLEEERSKLRDDAPPLSPFNASYRTSSPVASSRRGLTAEYLGLQNLQTRRSSSHRMADDVPTIPGFDRRSSRPSVVPQSSGHGTPKRVDSTTLFTPTGDTEAPSIMMEQEQDDFFERTTSPSEAQNHVNDIVSVSTVGAGPSVQLVERMSAAVRRLENEKVSTKEELARLARQRDEARSEIVALMKEVEEKRRDHERVGELEKEVEELNDRYNTTLEMLGEKSEQVEELRADIQDVKAMYRDLVQQTMK